MPPYPDEELMKFANQVWKKSTPQSTGEHTPHPHPSRPDPEGECFLEVSHSEE